MRFPVGQHNACRLWVGQRPGARRKSTYRRDGFTLIELVASAVLAAMLMGALMNIMWSVRRDMTRIQAADKSRAPVTILVDQLRADFQNARGLGVDASGITLHGFLSRDAGTADTMLRAGRVRYEMAKVGTDQVLVRRISTQSGSMAEPIWHGLGEFQVEPLLQSAAGDLLLAPETGGLPPIPARFRVTLRGADGRLLWHEVFDHHVG